MKRTYFPSACRVSISLAILLCPALAQTERSPEDKLAAHKVYKHQSEAGLDFTYSVPKAYAKGGPSGKWSKRLVVLCHGTGLDYRWGHANHSPKTFRPDDVVVSVSGPTAAANGSRLFLGNKKDRSAFGTFLEEMRTTFGAERVFLYGHSQGGFFVLDYAGAYPKDVAGVVAHASGAWASSATPKALRSVPLAFQHGSSDPVVPYRQSAGTRDAYEKSGMTVQLRRLEFYNHWPNELRTHEMLAWCDGMSCTTAAEALDAVREMLRPKKSDRYQWQTVPAFAAARHVLRRFEKGGDFVDADASEKKIAAAMTQAIEAAGAKHVKALTKIVPNKKSLALRAKGTPWLGHVLALREDFRGVECVDAWFRSLGYEALEKSHAKAAGKILKAWYGEKDEKKLWQSIAPQLAKGFLFDGYPPGLVKRLREIHDRGKSLRLGKKSLALGALVEEYQRSLSEGAKAYAKIWKSWKLPRG